MAKTKSTKKIKPKAKSLTSVKAKSMAKNQNIDYESTGNLQKIFTILRQYSFIDFSDYKTSTISRRIQRQMRLHKFENIDDYAEYLEFHPEAVDALYEDMFIHVTEFFRDPESFLTLKASVFPQLLKNSIPGVPLRIWVPGCASGEEVYSIVISLLEFLGSKATQTPVQIFATDISELAVQRARSGVYSEHQVKYLSKERLKKFFDVSKDGEYKVKKTIRDLCIFSRHDVANNPPFAKIDLISCRNVLIYFTSPLQKKVMPIFHYSLNPGGFLWLGKSEAPIGFSKLFDLVNKTDKLYSKLNVTTPSNFRFPTGRHLNEYLDFTQKGSGAIRTGAEKTNNDPQKEFERIALARYAPASVVVNYDMEITQVRGRTGRFLEFPVGQPNYNLLKALRPELSATVRATIQSAVKQNTTVRKEGLTYLHGSQRKKVNIEIIPANPTAPLKERQFFVFFEDETESKKSFSAKKVTANKKIAGGGHSKKNSNDNYIAQLLAELDSLREYQQSLAEGYELSQEELTSTNEELQSTNEELQSTNEEMETTKEELQAANEELTTINDELQSRNEELTTLNEKLTISEVRFRSLVEGVKDYAIFLFDKDGKIMTWNEGARRLTGYEFTEVIGQPFSIFYLSEDMEDDKPLLQLTEATKTGRIEDEGWRLRKDGTKFWANVIITRINDENENLIGFAKVTRDLTERKKSESDLHKSQMFLNSLIENIPDMVFVKEANDLRFIRFNKAGEELLGYSRHELIGKNDYDFFPKEQAQFFVAKDRAVLAGHAIVDIAEESIQTKSGPKILHTKKIGLRGEDGKAEYLLGISEDITYKKQAEEERVQLALTEVALKERDLAHRRATFLADASMALSASLDYRETINNLTTLMVPYLADWCTATILRENNSFEHIAGSHINPAKIVLIKELEKYTPTLNQPLNGVAYVIQTGESVFMPVFTESDLIAAVQDKAQLQLILDIGLTSFMVVPIQLRGKVLGAITFALSKTDRIYTREDLHVAEQLGRRAAIAIENTLLYATSQKAIQIRDEFLSLASHELKTPVTSLNLQVQIRQRMLEKSGVTLFQFADFKKMLEADEKQISRITRLIDDMLDVTRIHIGKLIIKPESVDLLSLINDVIERFSPQLKAARCEISFDEVPAIIGHWDRHRIEQVFINLLSNAMKYAAGHPIHIGFQVDVHKVRIAIQDYGEGIAQENIERIFGQFERVASGTNKASGLGLGLYIVRQIVEAHGGQVSAVSEMGKGSIFTVELPLESR